MVIIDSCAVVHISLDNLTFAENWTALHQLRIYCSFSLLATVSFQLVVRPMLISSNTLVSILLMVEVLCKYCPKLAVELIENGTCHDADSPVPVLAVPLREAR